MNSIFQSFKRVGTTLLLILVASCSGASNSPSGIVSLWADENIDRYGSCYLNGLQVHIYIDGIDMGPIQFRRTLPAKCGDFSDPLLFSRVLPVGIHTIAASNGSTCNWTEDHKVLDGACKTFILTWAAPAP